MLPVDDHELSVLDLIPLFRLPLQELSLGVDGSQTDFLSLLDIDHLNKLSCDTLNHVLLQGSDDILVLRQYALIDIYLLRFHIQEEAILVCVPKLLLDIRGFLELLEFLFGSGSPSSHVCQG